MGNVLFIVDNQLSELTLVRLMVLHGFSVYGNKDIIGFLVDVIDCLIDLIAQLLGNFRVLLLEMQ